MKKKIKIEIFPYICLCFLFLTGFLLGAILAVKKEDLFPEFNIFSLEFFSELNNITMDSGVVFLLALGKRLRSFLLFLLLSSSPAGLLYLSYFILSIGFSIGLALEVLLLNFGMTGAGIYLSIIFPQGIFYFLAYSILWMQEIKRRKEGERYFVMMNEKKEEKQKLIIALLLLLLGAVSEAYFNFFSLLFME